MNPNEPYVNTALLDLVQRARQTEIDADLDVIADKDGETARHLSELYRLVMNYDDDECAVCVAAILEKKSIIVHQVQEAERQYLLKKGKTNNDRNNS